MKKEFSEAGRGVVRPHNVTDVLRAIQKIWSRADGIGYVDLDVKIRIFLQREIIQHPGRSPVGYRFYAERGQVYGAHLSVIEHAVQLYGISYRTIRDAKVEQAAEAFIRAINYTGFGATWWWTNAEGKPHLIDFNPRLERHACINAAMVAADDQANTRRDPCVLFQRLRQGEEFDAANLPEMVDAGELLFSFLSFFLNFVCVGVRYYEPMRIVNIGMRPEAKKFVDILSDNGTFWNVHPHDHDLHRLHVVNVNNFVRDYNAMMVVYEKEQAEKKAAREAELKARLEAQREKNAKNSEEVKKVKGGL